MEVDATGFEGGERRARFARRGAGADELVDGMEEDGAARFDVALLDILVGEQRIRSFRRNVSSLESRR